MTLAEYAHATRGEHFAWWAKTYCMQSIDVFAGQPLELEPWQRSFFDEALAVDEEGNTIWSSVCAVLPRKQGKTTMLASYATFHCLEHDGSPEILLAASSDRQAGRLFDAVTAFIRRNEFLASQFHIRDYVGEIARVDGGGRILRMSSDPDRLHGFNPSLVVVDELHAWQAPRLRRAWAALTTAGGARKSAQVFTITTAGESHTRDTGILGRLIDGNERQADLEKQDALTISRNFAGKTLVWKYEAKTTDPTDTKAIKAANPASWITEEYLAK